MTHADDSLNPPDQTNDSTHDTAGSAEAAEPDPSHLVTPRSRGPWMLKFVGVWGTGLRSRFDFDVFVDDLGKAPDESSPGSAAAAAHAPSAEDATQRMFLPEIREDIEPTEGLDVDFGMQTLEHRAGTAWTVWTHGQ